MDKAGASIYLPVMPLSPEEIAAAKKMHAFVRLHEKKKSVRGPLTVSIMFSLTAIIILQARHPQFCVWYLAVLAVGLLLFALLYRLASARYQRDKVLLPVLERDHANELPWIQTEREEAEMMRHLAAVREIERELARRHHAI